MSPLLPWLETPGAALLAAVLETTPAEVVVGDPLEGVRRLPRAEFAGIWRGSGVVLRRPSR